MATVERDGGVHVVDDVANADAGHVPPLSKTLLTTRAPRRAFSAPNRQKIRGGSRCEATDNSSWSAAGEEVKPGAGKRVRFRLVKWAWYTLRRQERWLPRFLGIRRPAAGGARGRLALLFAWAALLPACSRGKDVSRCAQALIRIQNGMRANPGHYDYLPEYARNCAWIYRQPECRRAWQDAARRSSGPKSVTPGEDVRQAVIAAACKKAYCGRLVAPKPRLCASSGPTSTTASGHTDWPLLHIAILDRELADQPALLAALRLQFEPMYIASAQPSDLPKPLGSEEVEKVLYVSLTRSGEIWVGHKRVDAHRVEALARAARAGNPVVRAVIRADRAVPYGRVIHLLDLLKKAGIEKIALAVTASSDAGTR